MLEVEDDLIAEAMAAVERHLGLEEGGPDEDDAPLEDDEHLHVLEIQELDAALVEALEELEEMEVLASSKPPPTPDEPPLRVRVAELETLLVRAEEALGVAETRIQVLERARQDAETRRARVEGFFEELRTRLLAQENELGRLQRRTIREAERARQHGEEAAVRELLPVLDHLMLARQHADQDPTSLVAGVEIVSDQFMRILQRLGVDPVAAEPGGGFDPALHEAVLQAPSSRIPPGRILEVLRTGYTFHGRLLRAAQVSVAATPVAVEPAVPAAVDDTRDPAPPGGEE